jgi:hypothetical protein
MVAARRRDNVAWNAALGQIELSTATSTPPRLYPRQAPSLRAALRRLYPRARRVHPLPYSCVRAAPRGRRWKPWLRGRGGEPGRCCSRLTYGSSRWPSLDLSRTSGSNHIHETESSSANPPAPGSAAGCSPANRPRRLLWPCDALQLIGSLRSEEPWPDPPLSSRRA